MVTGALMAMLRQAPQKLLAWIKRRITVTVTILDRDPLFEWSKLWLDSLPYAKRTRTLLCSLHPESDEEFSSMSRTIFTPGYGQHFFLHRGRFVWLEYSKSEQPSGARNVPSPGGIRTPESLALTVLGTRQELARELIHEISAHAASEEKRKPRAYISSCGWWRRMPVFQPRILETVDLPREDESRILTSIEEFLDARNLYCQRGIPYHLNFLFEGIPGTGKTSLASALCGRFGLNLHLLNIAGPGMNDERLVELMMGLPRRSLLLMEDVDALVPERRDKPHMPAPQEVTAEGMAPAPQTPEGITLSGLLNCMDGITAPDGAVIVMTTNHPELIDPALLRPGRVDVRVHFGNMELEQARRMCARLIPGHDLPLTLEALLNQGVGMTAAEVQAEILTAQPRTRV